MNESPRAFVPGHVTAFFSVHRRGTPAETGSRGAGITLSDGVTTSVEPAAETSIRLDGGEIEMPPVERVLDALGVTGRVEAEGGIALGAALAANRAFDLGYSENDLVELAHVAEVEAGTGLGDVVAQARGGVPIRVEPGAPGYGRLDGVPDVGTVEWISFGDLSTGEVISGDTDDLSAAGESAMADLRKRPTLPRLFTLGREFAREADLLVPGVEEAIEAVRERGGEATMAMLGKTVIALDSGLSDAGYDAESCRVHPAGATLEDG